MALTTLEQTLVDVTESLTEAELDELSATANGGRLSPELRAKLQPVADGFTSSDRAELRAISGGDVEGFMINQHRKQEKPDDIPTPPGNGDQFAGFGNRFWGNVVTVANIFESQFPS